jgi:hypothetical protein
MSHDVHVIAARAAFSCRRSELREVARDSFVFVVQCAS